MGEIAESAFWDIIYCWMVQRRGEGLEKVREFFLWSVRRSFWDLNLKEPQISEYVAEVLTNFVRIENLYPLTNQRGEPLETIAEMLLEANMITLSGGSLYKEREIRKHIGDYALFMSGLFPEYVKRRSLWTYYLQQGALAYFQVSELNRALLRPGVGLFEELAKRFEFYVGALNYMRKAFFRDTLGDPLYFVPWIKRIIF